MSQEIDLSNWELSYSIEFLAKAMKTVLNKKPVFILD
jgi:hypothetical protein